MQHFKTLLHIAFILALFVSCAEKEITIPPLEVEISGKKVLVEELTGVRCPNCPSANARLEAIASLYPDHLIIVSVHGSLLTKPLDESAQDFRNPDAIALEQKYSPLIGKPSVVINRKVHPEFSGITNPVQDRWQLIIERELQQKQLFAIETEVIEDEAAFLVYTGILALEAYSGDIYFHSMVIENNIIDAQEDVDRVIPDYVHDHVLRDIIYPLGGNFLVDGMDEQQVVNTTFEIKKNMLHEMWRKENLEIVIFVSNDHGEILEADILSLVK